MKIPVKASVRTSMMMQKKTSLKGTSVGATLVEILMKI